MPLAPSVKRVYDTVWSACRHGLEGCRQTAEGLLFLFREPFLLMGVDEVDQEGEVAPHAGVWVLPPETGFGGFDEDGPHFDGEIVQVYRNGWWVERGVWEEPLCKLLGELAKEIAEVGKTPEQRRAEEARQKQQALLDLAAKAFAPTEVTDVEVN